MECTLPSRPAPGSASLLGSLPAEILFQISEHLVPEPSEIGETRPVSYHKLMPGEPWFEFTRCRCGLRSLSLVSRQLSEISRPLLYRLVSILDEEGMVLFLRTLTERPEFGLWTRYFSCHLTLTRDSVVREIRRSFGRLLRTFHPDAPGLNAGSPIGRALAIVVLALPVLNTPVGGFDDVPQVLLFFILTLLKRVETLLIQLPICDHHPEYTALFEKLAKVSEEDSKRRHDTTEPPFRHVRTLMLQGDPELMEHFESDDCSCEVPEVWGCQARDYWPLFEALPNLTTLEVSSDDGAWRNARDASGEKDPKPYLGRIRHVYLHNSICCPRTLHHVVKNAPSLQTLYMTPRLEDDFEHGPAGDDSDAHPEALDNALLEHAPKLRHLDVAWFDCRGFDCLIGPEGRLASLPRMRRLETLCVQLCVLYGNNPATLFTPLADLLPPSLVELALEEWRWSDLDTLDEMDDWIASERVTHYQAKQEYRAAALGILEQFALDCPRRLPRLRKVSFLTKIPWTWKLEGFVGMESHFQGIRRILEGGGVEFIVDEI